MSKYTDYLKKLEEHPFNFWKINQVAFNYLSNRLKYLEKEQHLLFIGFSYSKATKEQRDHYLFKDWLLNNEKRKTLNKWKQIEKDLLIKLGVILNERN